MRLNGVMLNYRENITANIRLVSKKTCKCSYNIPKLTHAL